MTEFEDSFTLDGLVSVPNGVTRESVGQVKKLITEAKRGSFVAEAQLKESMFNGGLTSSVSHFLNIITIPQLPSDKERPVAKLAGFRTVPDFRPAVLYSAFGNAVSGPGIQADGSLARVPQGTPYPVVTVGGSPESAYAKIAKRGARVNWDFEDMINDLVGALDGIPAELLDVALQTEWAEVGEALIAATVNLPAVTLPDGTASLINAAVSPNAIFAAIQALAARTINGASHTVGTLSGYNVVVPVGQKVYVDYQIQHAMNIVQVLPGSAGGAVYRAPDNSALLSVDVIEHELVTGTKWYLAPKPGSFRRPVLDLLRLRGYETPQLRVRSEGGDGMSFDADTASLRLRMVTGAALWDANTIVYSKGTGAA